jgi:MFS family permease
LGIIYGLVFFGGIVRSFIGPSIFSLIAQLVPKKAYPNAVTWSSSMWQLASVIGPAFAGLFIAQIGVNSAMLVVVLTGTIAFICLLQIEKKPILNKNIGEPMMESLKQGLSFVFKSKAILGAITLDMIAVLFGGAIALLPVYAQVILKVGPEGYGIMRAAPAIGALIIVIITAYLPIARNAGMKLLIAVFGFGLCIIGFGLSTVFWFSVILLFLSGVTDGISVVIRQTILQLKAPEHMRGRVSSVNSIFIGSSNELGAFESGVAARLMGTVTAVVFGGTMTLITVIGTAFVSPTFRKLDLVKDMETDEKE